MGFWMKLLFHLKKTECKHLVFCLHLVLLVQSHSGEIQQFYWLVLGRIRKYFIPPPYVR